MQGNIGINNEVNQVLKVRRISVGKDLNFNGCISQIALELDREKKEIVKVKWYRERPKITEILADIPGGTNLKQNKQHASACVTCRKYQLMKP